MTMQSLDLTSRAAETVSTAVDAGALNHDETVSRIRGMDRDHFAIEVSLATEEAMEALFQARNVPDELNEAFGRAFSDVAEKSSLHDHYQEMVDRGSGSVTGFVSNLKGKIAELKTESALEERFPGGDFRLPGKRHSAGMGRHRKTPGRI